VSRLRLKAESRDTFGKGASRRVRREGRIPAVIYGRGSTLLHVSIDAKEITLALRKSGVILEIDTPSGVVLTAPRDVQRDPVKRTIEHIDLIVVDAAAALAVEVAAEEAAAARVAENEAIAEKAEAAASARDAADAADVAAGEAGGSGAQAGANASAE
jgi:large subunit ribosomal protein L25